VQYVKHLRRDPPRRIGCRKIIAREPLIAIDGGAGKLRQKQSELKVNATYDKASVREYDSAFCANTDCVLHVRPGDVNVKGCGNWAELADDIIVGRQRVEGIMLCDRCAARVLCGQLALRRVCAA